MQINFTILALVIGATIAQGPTPPSYTCSDACVFCVPPDFSSSKGRLLQGPKPKGPYGCVVCVGQYVEGNNNHFTCASNISTYGSKCAMFGPNTKCEFPEDGYGIEYIGGGTRVNRKIPSSYKGCVYGHFEKGKFYCEICDEGAGYPLEDFSGCSAYKQMEDVSESLQQGVETCSRKARYRDLEGVHCFICKPGYARPFKGSETEKCQKIDIEGCAFFKEVQSQEFNHLGQQVLKKECVVCNGWSGYRMITPGKCTKV